MLEKNQIEKNHEICLELLDKFLDVCEKHHIDYYFAFGSALGAVRHKGFIPWDINIDVLMTSSEFKRLDAIMQKENLGNMKWCCPNGSARIFPLLMRDDSWEHPTKPNIDISIYVNAPNNIILRTIIIKAAYLNIKMYKLKNTDVKRNFPYNLLKMIATLFPNRMYKRFVSGIEKISRKHKSDYLMVILPSVWKDRETIKTEWLGEESLYIEFEGRKVRVLKGYHEYLTHRYGDYMTPKVWVDKGEYKHTKG